MKESIPVSALNQYTRMLLEADEVLSQVWVEGELSGVNVHHKSGHVYFSLKDSACSVRAVMFCEYASALRFIPKDGMYVVARCKVSLYERDGTFQLYVYDLMPQGQGAVQKQLDTVKAQLQAEGLFSPERKRPLPAQPHTIAVITSADAAALHDIISVTSRRNPLVRLKVYNASVQGVRAVDTIIQAIGLVNADPSVDVAIIARGGGSAEDLWYFNDEQLVRAAARIAVPFISAVGHETDTTLVDFVSDARAPTPSAAAELAVPDVRVRLVRLRETHAAMRGHIDAMLARAATQAQSAAAQLTTAVDCYLSHKYKETEQLGLVCRSLDPAGVLLRGYAYVKRGDAGADSVTQLSAGDAIEVILKDGAASCTVNQVICGEGSA